MDEQPYEPSEREQQFKRLLLVFAIVINVLISIYFILLLVPDAEEPTLPPAAPPDGQPIKVEVLNGCGINNASTRIADFLREPHIDVLQTGNYESFEIEETLVIDLTGYRWRANYVAAKLGLDSLRVVTIINPARLLDVSVIAGRDFTKLKLDKKL